MPITVSALRLSTKRARAALGRLEQQLNAADSRLGDGDTGTMLTRVIGAMAAADIPETADIGAAFGAYARAAAAATGSSLGTLFATALLTLSRETRGRESLPWREFGDLLEKANATMMARGGAKLGDKTVLDAVQAMAQVLSGLEDSGEVGERAVAAVDLALNRFRDQPNRVGRARMFSEASIGLDDPGMLAFAELVRAISAGPDDSGRSIDPSASR